MADLGIIFLRRRYPNHWYQSSYIFITGSMPFRYFWATLYSSWARDSKSNFVYRQSFSSKFQSNSSPRCKGPITLDEAEWQNNEFVRKNDEFDPIFIPNSLSDTDKFQWQLTNLNAELLNLIDKIRMWMTIWRNWTIDLNLLLRTKLNENLMKLNEEVTKMGGKTYSCNVQ